MAKTKVSEWDSVAANNTDINSININEGCPPSTINNAIRELMKEIKDWQDGSSGDGWTSSGTVTASGTLVSSGTLSVTGNLTLDGASGTSGQYLTSSGSGSTPTWTSVSFPDAFTAGMIIMWSGTIATIPSGWLLCDGTSSTDLRNQFVIGAHSDSGGAAKTTVTGSSTLSGGSKDAIVVSHTHTATSSSENAHSHTYDKAAGATRADGTPFDPYVFSGHTSTSTNTVPAHNHTITVSSAGSSGTNANLPPYYALAYIMKS
jgi:microcystin-dependent protein